MTDCDKMPVETLPSGAKVHTGFIRGATGDTSATVTTQPVTGGTQTIVAKGKGSGKGKPRRVLRLRDPARRRRNRCWDEHASASRGIGDDPQGR